MKLSIVIPAYNEEDYIGACLTAIERERQVSGFDMEVIVVNNASQDRTGMIARSFSFVQVVDEPKKGLVQARQSGYRASHGDLIANIDADTRMPAGWLKRVFLEFETQPQLVALSGPYEYYDLSRLTNVGVRFFYSCGKMVSVLNTLVTGQSGTMLQGGNFVLRRTALERVGGFDLRYDFYGEDTAIAKLMSREGIVKFTFRLPMATSGRRLRAEGLWVMVWRYAANFLWANFLGRAYSRDYKDVRL
ncbi:MAG: glycosyltransferase family 2 protein [Candidatus Moranbacteria bacterium]|jgi:glycosyltransferase involved in cell wall biosynthesis|nr:glycosyltransferase family 2 protein [Candidatus Moranbacteria bacterium]